MSDNIVTEISGGVGGFLNFLVSNPGVVIVKFGATWCGPCKVISGNTHIYMNDIIEKFPGKVICCDIDIDDNFEIYATLKQKKMVSGIPAILCWNAGNVSLIPDDSTIGADINQIKQLFLRCASRVS